MRRTPWVAFWLCVACAAAPHGEEGFDVRVTHVFDGDSFEARRGEEALTVRLHGVDCPERDQPFAGEARRFTTDHVRGRSVRVEPRDRDAYGRVVGRVTAGGADLGLALVEAGLAWHFARYSDDAALAAAERRAREQRRGLWAADAPEPPWEFRARTAARPAGGDESPGAEPAAAPAYVGNVRSRVFHRLSCPNAACPSCTRRFSTRDEALAEGYRPAGCCRP